MNIARLDHLVLTVADIERTCAFYTRVLGMEVVMDRANALVLLVGRLLMASLFLPSGFSKLMGFSAFAASLGPKGLPYPETWAAAAVAIERSRTHFISVKRPSRAICDAFTRN